MADAVDKRWELLKPWPSEGESRHARREQQPWQVSKRRTIGQGVFGFREIVGEEFMTMFLFLEYQDGVAIRVPITMHAMLELLKNATKLYQLILETKKHQAGLLAEEMHMWALSAGQVQKQINCLYLHKQQRENVRELSKKMVLEA
ncbi:hypothetical protein CFC21_036941 [Triticum aestivum]|uniref:Uncharacterized protein n=4 Tax=Triticum TaxID=4564 RepID=A0A9R0RXE0_TRITD|nr:hypothetical protein TRIUR3_21830 [Triticum urartu]KAF7024624.1 hypothetical protein CFC21_036941 [Triticum aestivum]VAH66226.1 unnamed protein product [Triticum turgidum subsp. durum]